MRRSWRLAVAVGGVILLSCQAQAINCDDAWYTIITQADADNISRHIASTNRDCMSAYGLNIVVSPLSRGTIEITAPPEKLQGDLTVDNALHLERLVVMDKSGEYRGFRDVRFTNLSSLTSIEFRTRNAPYTTSLINLPVLDSTVFDLLWYSNELLLVDLPRLTNITASSSVGILGRNRANTTVQNVPLDSVQEAFGVNAAADSILAFDSIPNVKNLTIAHSLKSLDFAGSGDVSLLLNCTSCFTRWGLAGPRPWGGFELGDIRLSGLSSVSRYPVDMWPSNNEIYVQTFRAVNNTFRTLDLGFNSLTNLHVEDNPNLESINFHANAFNHNWAEIVITGNPSLRLKSAVWTSSEPNKNMTSTFYWPQRACLAMVFDGPFDNEFFQPFIDIPVPKDNATSQGPRVLQKFVVSSSLGPDRFNCTQLHRLRAAGVFQGEYSCQGESPGINGAPHPWKTPGSATLLVGVAMVWYLRALMDYI